MKPPPPPPPPPKKKATATEWDAYLDAYVQWRVDLAPPFTAQQKAVLAHVFGSVRDTASTAA